MTEQKEPPNVSVMLELLGMCIGYLLQARGKVDDTLSRVMLAKAVCHLAEQPLSLESLRSFWGSKTPFLENDFQLVQSSLERLKKGGLPESLSLLERGPGMAEPMATLLTLIHTSQEVAIFEVLLYGVKEASDCLKEVDALVTIYAKNPSQPLSELTDWQGRLEALSESVSCQLEVSRALYDLGVRCVGIGKMF
jgi:hypothetical protein